MDKTLKQIAEEFDVSKDKVKYQLRKLDEKYIIRRQGIIYVKDEGVELLGNYLGNTRVITQMKNRDLQAENLELRHQLEIQEIKNKGSEEKLELLEKQNEEQKDRIDKLMKLVDQAQQLQAIAEQKIQTIECKGETPQKKHWWNK